MALADLLRAGLPAPVPPALPGLDRLTARARRVMERWPDLVREPPEKDRERLVQAVRARVETGHWAGTTLSQVTAAARALYDRDRRGRADLAPLRAFYLAEIRASTRPGFLGAMVETYLASFEPGAPHSRDLARALLSARGRLTGRWARLCDGMPGLFDPDTAHEAIAARMVEMASPYAGLKALGLSSPHGSGLMDHAHLAYLGRIARELATPAGARRLFDWLAPPGQPPRQSGAAEAIAALLDPWLTRAPDAEMRGLLVETLVGLYHDPRVHPGGAWAGLPEAHRTVVMRWLTGENIRFFLDVVSEVEDSHMWAPRRAFWLGLFEQGRIAAAWVAFSDRGIAVARQRRQAREGATVGYGRQVAGGARVNTSLLILQIGNRIVVEGSHSYKVHIFRSDRPGAPRLYQPRYDCELIRLIPGAEAKPHLGNWQGWVLERI